MTERRVSILAKTLLRDLLSRGLEPQDVVAVVAELVDEAAERRITRRSSRESREQQVDRHHPSGDERLQDTVRTGR